MPGEPGVAYWNIGNRERASTPYAVRTTSKAPRTWAVSRRISQGTRTSPRTADVSGSLGAALPSTPGNNLMEMIDAAGRGELRALWAIGYDVFLTNPNTATNRRALSNLELVIVQDMFWNERPNRQEQCFCPRHLHSKRTAHS